MDLDLNTRVRPNCFLAINDLAKAIDNKAQVSMAILDFSKAFHIKLPRPD